MFEDFEILSVELTRPEDRHIPAYDYTTLTAMNTCPTWGAIRYLHGKAMQNSHRPVPLEMGAACHSAFAAIRLYQLGYHQSMPAHMHHHGHAIFKDKWDAVHEPMADTSERVLERVRRAMMAAFHSSGFIDDPYDRRRTVSNAEVALYVYLDQWDFKHNVWVQDERRPEAPVGVELLVDFVVTARVPPGYISTFRVPVIHVCGDNIIRIRYVGRVDGLHHHGERLRCHENKTGGRLDDAWEHSFSTSHQVTGYSVAACLYADAHVSEADVIGLQIPVPKDTFSAVRRVPLQREKHHYLNWMRWLFHTLEKVWLYKDTPLHAPQYSHSCNRYFRPCSFIPLCYADEDERAEGFAQMVDDRWTPLRDYESKVGE